MAPTTGQDEAAAAAAADSASPDQASSEASSAASSPLRWPSLPRVVKGETAFGDKIYGPYSDIDPAIARAYPKLKAKYFAEQDRQLKLVSLDPSIPDSCMDDLELLPVRELVSKPSLQIAKVAVVLSSHIDGKLSRRTSGFLIDWDAESKTGTVMTSALVIQSKSPSPDEWLAKEEYTPHAEVCVHLMDKTQTTTVADLLHYDKHYNLALFKIAIDLCTHIPLFTTELKFADKVFVLGRDVVEILV